MLAATALATVAASPSFLPRASADDGTTLRSAVRGDVVLPDDAGFDAARRPWFLSVDQTVRAVVSPVDVDDAAALVHHARNTGSALAIQPNGHSGTAAVDGAILVRTNHFDEVSVDAGRASARVGAGVSWRAVQAAAARVGLLPLAGSAPGVGVVGYLLGGGLSWFSRAYGWGTESVTAVDGLTADGDRFRATATTDVDLFWALRGGGGDFAFVTAIEFDLYPAPTLVGGSMRWPADRNLAVLTAFRDVTTTAPDELTIWFTHVHAPGGPPLVGVDVTFLGDMDTARSLLKAFDDIPGVVSDTRRILDLDDTGSITNEPTAPTALRQQAMLLGSLSDEVIEFLASAPMDPLLTFQLRHLGGALRRQSNTAAGSLAEPYLANFVGRATTPTAAAATQARVHALRSALGSVVAERVPFTLLAPEQSAAQAFPAQTLARLRDVKEHRDPRGVLRSNHPVRF